MSARLIEDRFCCLERSGARVEAASAPRVLPFRDIVVMEVDCWRGERWGVMSSAVVSFRDREERENMVLEELAEAGGGSREAIWAERVRELVESDI